MEIRRTASAGKECLCPTAHKVLSQFLIKLSAAILAFGAIGKKSGLPFADGAK
jgi:hypothetical protein